MSLFSSLLISDYLCPTSLNITALTKSQKEIDELYMQRCLDLAKQGIEGAAPNPMVGSVIVCNGQIIGEGYHEKCGEPHAEVNAINDVKDKSLLPSSTLYVNLEPCAHYGKTPPCSLLIKQSKIPRVVVGCVDPFAKVAGKGIAIMEEAGIEVTVGVLEQASLELNKRFITFHGKKRPYIILKWAESSDGFIDTTAPIPTWLTNEESRALVHKMRAEEASVMVGTVAALKDNPSLTTRSWKGDDTVRVTLDRNARIPSTHTIFDQSVPTIVFTSQDVTSKPNLTYVKIDFSADVLGQCLSYLHSINLTSIIIEGGEQLLRSFIEKGLWDEAWQFVGPIVISDGTKAPAFNATPIDRLSIRGVDLFCYRNQ